MCNSVNLKLGGIIEPSLKIHVVNVLCMCPGLGVAHSNQLVRHGYGRVYSVSAFIASGEVSKKVLCTWKILFASGIQTWKWKSRGSALARDHVFYF